MKASLYSRDMATVVLLVSLGLLLLFLETLLPGLIAGFCGIVCLIGGVVLGYERFGFGTGNIVLLVVMVLSAIGGALYVTYFPNSRMAAMFTSNSVSGNLNVERPELVGESGQALTPLRPSGKAIINGKTVDVVSEGMMIERGSTVKVVDVEGLRVVVRVV